MWNRVSLFNLAVSLIFLHGATAVPPSSGGLWISTIDAPTQCALASVVISGGQAPYSLVVVRGDNYEVQLNQVASNLPAGELSWNCNVAQGTAFALKVIDCVGNVAWSAARTVSVGSDACPVGLIQGSPGQSCACNEPAPQPVQVTPIVSEQTSYASPTLYTTVTVKTTVPPSAHNTCYGTNPKSTARWVGRFKRDWYDGKVSDNPNKDGRYRQTATAHTIYATETVDGAYDFECSAGSRYGSSATIAVVCSLFAYAVILSRIGFR